MKKKGLILGLFLLCLTFFGCAKKQGFTNTIFAFDTNINVTLFEGKEENLNDICEIYFRISKLADAYKEYKDLQNICAINKAIKNNELEFIIGIDLYNMLNVDLELRNALNPASGALTTLWKETINSKTLPPSSEIEGLVLAIKNNELDYSLTKEDNNYKLNVNTNLVQFDLGAIAKGYATALVKKYLTDNSITKYMIDCGRSTILLGTKDDSTAYNVGVDNTNNFVIRDVKGKCIGSASILERNVVIDGVKYHHIIDLSTGYPTDNYDTVVLIGDNPLMLDILSTYLMIKPDEAESIINKYNVDSYYMFKDGELVKSGTKS